jgi:hypothetical protein
MTFLGRLLGRDRVDSLKDVVINLELLADAEAKISDFYRECANAMPDETELWNHLAGQELQHSAVAQNLLERIAKEPALYKTGTSFSTVAIRMFAMELQRLVEQMKDGRIPADRLYAIALEIENSAVEMSYGKLVKTGDAIFNSLADRIDAESAEHRSAISAKMESAPNQ